MNLSPRFTETCEEPLNRPRLRAGACSFPGFSLAAMLVAGIWSSGIYPGSLGYSKAWTRSGGTGYLVAGNLPRQEQVPA